MFEMKDVVIIEAGSAYISMLTLDTSHLNAGATQPALNQTVSL